MNGSTKVVQAITEVAAARVEADQFAAVVFVVYRPVSTAVHSALYDELASVFKAVVNHQLPVYIVGDVRLYRHVDPHARQLLETVNGFGFSVRPTGLTFWAGLSTLSLTVPISPAQTFVPSTLRFRSTSPVISWSKSHASTSRRCHCSSPGACWILTL
jgi:hypothetical protein